MQTFRESQRLERSQTLIDKPDQSHAMECAAIHATSIHFSRNCDFFRFVDWRFGQGARLNLIPLNGPFSCGTSIDVGTRLPRPRRQSFYAVLYSLHAKTQFSGGRYKGGHGWSIRDSVQEPGLKPGSTTLIIEVTCPFDNRIEVFKEAARENKLKYEDPRTDLLSLYPGEVTVVPS